MAYVTDPVSTLASPPCPAGSKSSAVRCATWFTLPTARSRRPSSAPADPTSCCRATSAPCSRPKDHVNVFLYDGAIVPDPEGIITGGHDNKTARTVAIRHGETINANALTAMFKQIIANNRTGGWRKRKPRAGSPE